MADNDVIDLNIIEDLLCRFILNLPPDERKDDRLFFHIQAAHWFYVDFYVDNKQIIEDGFHCPDVSLKEFSRQIYQICPFLKREYFHFNEVFNKFNTYLCQIPVFGAIILNKNMDKLLLVTNVRKTRYGFPKGKINQNETGLECAIREVWEEIGLDISKKISEKDFIEYKASDSKISKMYIISGIPESTYLKTHTRNEIGSIEWISMSTIEDCRERDKFKFSSIQPYVKALKVWIKDYKDPRIRCRQVSNHGTSNDDNTNTNSNAGVLVPGEGDYYEYSSDEEFYFEDEDQIFLSFSRKLEEITDSYDKIIVIEKEEKEAEENPFKTFKLDRKELQGAFL